MMIPIFLPLLQKAINHYLALDPEVRARLEPLSERVLRITITQLNWQFYVKVEHQRLTLLANHEGAIDASISGSPLDFLQLWGRSLQGKTEFPKEVTLTGDVNFIQTINDIFQQVDIDWEEQLSTVTGDIVAHQIGNVARGARDWLKQTTKTFTANLSEYIQEEKNLLVPPMAVEDFCKDVDVLRDDFQRVQARIKKIKKIIEE